MAAKRLSIYGQWEDNVEKTKEARAGEADREQKLLVGVVVICQVGKP